MGAFYCKTLHVGGGTVTRTRYDAAEGQLRKCLLLAGAGAAACCEHEQVQGGAQPSQLQTGAEMSNVRSTEISNFIFRLLKYLTSPAAISPASSSSSSASASASSSKRPSKDDLAQTHARCEERAEEERADRGAAAQVGAGAVLDAKSEIVVLEATAQLSVLLRVPGGPLKGAQAVRSSMEALLSIRRLPLQHVARPSGSMSAAQLAAWQAVAEAVTGLTKELATLPGTGVSLGGQKEVAKETLKDLFRQALKLKPQHDETAVRRVLEILLALARLFSRV